MNIESALKEKKIIVYGTGKFRCDFEYVFDGMRVAYYIKATDKDEAEGTQDSINGKPVKDTFALTKENPSDILIIICLKDKQVAKEQLQKHGLVENKHFIEADALFSLLDFSLARYLAGRKLAFWGTGKECDYLECNTDYVPDIYIDKGRGGAKERQNLFETHRCEGLVGILCGSNDA